LETNVARHWDILTLELESENKDPQLWDNFYDALPMAYGSVNQELVARNNDDILITIYVAGPSRMWHSYLALEFVPRVIMS
jgi:hypothetical protein